MAKLIDGKLISTQIKEELKEEVAKLNKKELFHVLQLCKLEKIRHHLSM